ncbi:MAG: hypothetical protein E7604_06655 [Ruminococcaceae bacterium]|nr:hypothetical protein [Oscillospiraceae bacterium]
MRNRKKFACPIKYVCCLCLTCVLLCLTVFAAVPENGNSAPVMGADRTAGEGMSDNGRTGEDHPIMGAVTDAADAVGDVVSDAGDVVGDVVSDAGEVVGDIGNAAGDAVSDAGDAVGDMAGDIGGSVNDAANADDQNTSPGAAVGGTQSENTPGTALPYDNSAADVTPGNAGAANSATAQNPGSSFTWIWILILVAAAAAIFFLLLMPRRGREM